VAISFANIPAAGALRTPFYFVEFDGSAAGSAVVVAKPALVVGQGLAAGSVAEETIKQVFTGSEAKGFWGEGSVMAEMVTAYRENDAFGELHGISYDDEAGTKATKTLTFGGTATEDGVISLYINGQLIETTVSDTDAAAAVATAVDAALTAASDLPYTNGVASEVVTLTARHFGTVGNEIDVRANYLDTTGGQKLPAGITLAIAVGATGATDPSLSGLGALLGDIEYDYILHPWPIGGGSGQMDEIDSMLLDTGGGRWQFDRRIFGHAFTALKDTVSNLGTFGNARNGTHHTLFALDSPAAATYQVTAAAVGQIKPSIDTDPARPLQTLVLNGILGTAPVDRFTQAQRNTLLFDGLATLVTDRTGAMALERVTTTYQTDAAGNPDDAFLDLNTLATLTYIARSQQAAITGAFPRHKLVADSSAVGAGQAVADTDDVKAVLVDDYLRMLRLGIVENLDGYLSQLTLEIDAGDPNRVNVLDPPDLVNQLRVVASKIQHRLNYPTT